jgi:hypothetical protein
MNMKNISFKMIATLLGLLTIFFSSSTLAESTSKDDLINQLESLYFQQQFISVDSPFLDMYLGVAKSKNSGVSAEDWTKIKEEVAPAVAKVTMEKGGPFDLLFRESVKDMSADELRKLLIIFNEPAYKKFLTASTNPANQSKFMGAMFSYGEKVNSIINQILVQNGLEEVH